MYHTSRRLTIAFLTCASITCMTQTNYKLIQALATQDDLILNVRNPQGNFALLQHVPQGKQFVAEIKIEDLPNPNDLLFDAIIHGSLVDVQRAVSLGANVNAIINHNLPLFWAITFKHTQIAAFLIKRGARVV